MENVYYRLEMIETTDVENIIILADSLVYGDSNSDINYETDYDSSIVRIDIDLTSFDNEIDLTGNTSYTWRVIAQNYESDMNGHDPDYNANDETYSFYTDLTLPTIDMVYLHDEDEYHDNKMIQQIQFYYQDYHLHLILTINLVVLWLNVLQKQHLFS